MRKAWLCVLTLLVVPLCHGAEVYPSKPVRIIVPSGPGSVTDFTARVISQQLSDQLGKQFVVDNRTGASGTIGIGAVAKSAPDGYTLMVSDIVWTMVPGLYKSLPYDTGRDFAPITQILGGASVLVAQPALNVSTIKDFMALAQSNPGKLNYGSGGTGGPGHLIAALFKSAAKINIVHVPYKNGTEAFSAILGNQVQMIITGIPTALPHVKNGLLRALAVTTDGKRSPLMPDVPSFIEAGVPGMVVYNWWGMSGPAGMPKELVGRLHGEVIKAMAVPSVRERLVAGGSELVGSTPQEFSKLVRSELQRWAGVIISAGITPE